MFPDAVSRAIVLCSSAKTAEHNKVCSSPVCCAPSRPRPSISAAAASLPSRSARCAIGHIYAGWALSQDFYRERLHLTALGAADLETYLKNDWEASFQKRRAADCYAQLVAWLHSDISAGTLYNSDLAKALGAIKAKVLLMPSETDLYFRVADNALEMQHLAKAKLLPIPSIWGHRGGNPSVNPTDKVFVKAAVRRWLD
jgi:homoserine O-acetyltransferase/O-succinyltransferase